MTTSGRRSSGSYEGQFRKKCFRKLLPEDLLPELGFLTSGIGLRNFRKTFFRNVKLLLIYFNFCFIIFLISVLYIFLLVNNELLV